MERAHRRRDRVDEVDHARTGRRRAAADGPRVAARPAAHRPGRSVATTGRRASGRWPSGLGRQPARAWHGHQLALATVYPFGPVVIRTDTLDGIPVVIIDRPERRNTLVPELAEALVTSLRAACETRRPVVLTASGTAFCLGAD